MKISRRLPIGTIRPTHLRFFLAVKEAPLVELADLDPRAALSPAVFLRHFSAGAYILPDSLYTETLMGHSAKFSTAYTDSITNAKAPTAISIHKISLPWVGETGCDRCIVRIVPTHANAS